MLVAIFNAADDFLHVGCSKMGGKSRVARDTLEEFLFRIASAVTEAYQVGRRQCSRPFRREGALAVETVVDINGASLTMGRNSDATAHVAHDEIEVLVAPSRFTRKAPRDGSLVERMPDGHSRHEGRPADACHVFHLVDHARIGNEGPTAWNAHGELIGNNATEVASMLALGVIHVVAHQFVDLINATLDGFGQSATPDDGIKLEADIELFEFADDEVAAKLALVDNTVETLQFVHRMADVAQQQRRLVFVERNFCGRGTGIDNEDSHGVGIV